MLLLVPVENVITERLHIQILFNTYWVGKEVISVFKCEIKLNFFYTKNEL